jgi:hypothetical protein
MDDIKPISNQGFFSYVFKLSKFKQEDLLNIIQYSMLSIIPVIIFIFFTKKYFPIVTEEDSSLYTFMVTFIELIFMIMGIFFIDRIINYIPTYSGKYYEAINLTNIVLIFILFMLIVHGGFRERANLLLQRFDTWFTLDDMIVKKLGMVPRDFSLFSDDITSAKNSKKSTKGKTASKPGVANSNASGAGGQQMSQQYAVPAPLPTQGPAMPNYGASAPMQQPTNFNNMYANTTTPMVGAATPGMDDNYMEPQAANGVLGGGSSWSSW